MEVEHVNMSNVNYSPVSIIVNPNDNPHIKLKWPSKQKMVWL